MEKDHERLTFVSKLFTEKTLECILMKVTGSEDVSVTEWIFTDAAVKGDGYLSTVDRITIEGVADGKPISIRIVVKSLPQNIGRRKSFRSTDFFSNEIIFYTKIVPVFDKFLESKNQTHLLRVPKLLSYALDGENDFIVLEDVSVSGFGRVSRQSTVDLEECRVILTGMARLHAVSFAHRDQHGDEFYNAAVQLRETYYVEKYWKWYEKLYTRVFGMAKDALIKEYGETPETKKFLDIKGRTLCDRCYILCDAIDNPTSVITQGDSWAPNFLMRTNDSTGEKEAMLLDFQLARCASPVTDLSFFIYSCTDKTLRDEEFDNLLAFYYHELTNVMRILGSDPDKIYPWAQFMKEVKDQFVHGLNFSLEAIPFAMLDENESFDLNVIEGDEAVNIADIFTLKLIVKKDRRQRLADVVMHAIQQGYLDCVL